MFMSHIQSGNYRSYSAVFRIDSPKYGRVYGEINQLANGDLIVSWPGYSEPAGNGSTELSAESRRALFIRSVLNIFNPGLSANVPNTLEWYRSQS